jgi:hypothetical protein
MDSGLSGETPMVHKYRLNHESVLQCSICHAFPKGETPGCIHLDWDNQTLKEVDHSLTELFGISYDKIWPKRFPIDKCLVKKADLLVLLCHDQTKANASVVVRIGTDTQLDNERRVLQEMDRLDESLPASARLRLVYFTTIARTKTDDPLYLTVTCPSGIPLDTIAFIVDKATALRLGKLLVDSLVSLYQRYGLIHFDIKPSNLILINTSDNQHQRVILIDFGLSKFTRDDDRFPYGCTAMYASEKQRNSDTDVGHVDDIFSICATVYALEYGLDKYEKEHDEALPLSVMLERSGVVTEIYRYVTRYWCCFNFMDSLSKIDFGRLRCTSSESIDVVTPSHPTLSELFYASMFFCV